MSYFISDINIANFKRRYEKYLVDLLRKNPDHVLPPKHLPISRQSYKYLPESSVKKHIALIDDYRGKGLQNAETLTRKTEGSVNTLGRVVPGRKPGKKFFESKWYVADKPSLRILLGGAPVPDPLLNKDIIYRKNRLSGTSKRRRLADTIKQLKYTS